jgi:hypothetical protein
VDVALAFLGLLAALAVVAATPANATIDSIGTVRRHGKQSDEFRTASR